MNQFHYFAIKNGLDLNYDLNDESMKHISRKVFKEKVSLMDFKYKRLMNKLDKDVNSLVHFYLKKMYRT